jgi:hypothetical protein
MSRGSAVTISTTSPGVSSLRRRGRGAGGGLDIPERVREGNGAARRLGARRGWALLAAVGLFAGTLWLRTPGVPYLAVAAAATLGAAALAGRLAGPARGWALASLVPRARLRGGGGHGGARPLARRTRVARVRRRAPGARRTRAPRRGGREHGSGPPRRRGGAPRPADADGAFEALAPRGAGAAGAGTRALPGRPAGGLGRRAARAPAAGPRDGRGSRGVHPVLSRARAAGGARVEPRGGDDAGERGAAGDARRRDARRAGRRDERGARLRVRPRDRRRRTRSRPSPCSPRATRSSARG